MAKDHGNQDAANNMPRWISRLNDKEDSNANRTAAFSNTTPGKWAVFTTDENKAQANPGIAMAGIIARRQGTGGRAGRVQTEVLIAGSTLGKNPTVQAAIPSALVQHTPSRPFDKAVTAPAGTTLSVVPAFRPTATGASATYLWEQSTNGGTTWTTVTNAGVFTGATSATLTISNTTGLNTYKYRCTIGVTNGASKVSRVSTLTIS
jgi:hypothetical protein